MCIQTRDLHVMVESSLCRLIQAAHLMLDCIPEDLLHKVLDRLSFRNTARLVCVSPQLHEAVLCAMSCINLMINPQSPEEAQKLLYWLAAVSARPRTYSRLHTLQLHILAPADKFVPALKLPGEYSEYACLQTCNCSLLFQAAGCFAHMELALVHFVLA